jgi:hypothetical protein
MRYANSPEINKLLGGYATGNLDEAEKLALFSAALEHQEVFDSLMDEDVLKQILDNPESRAVVIAALAQDSESSDKPKALISQFSTFWRKPLWMSLTAGVFLVLITSYAIKQQSFTSGNVFTSTKKAYTEQSPSPVPDPTESVLPQEVSPKKDVTLSDTASITTRSGGVEGGDKAASAKDKARTENAAPKQTAEVTSGLVATAIDHAMPMVDNAEATEVTAFHSQRPIQQSPSTASIQSKKLNLATDRFNTNALKVNESEKLSIRSATSAPSEEATDGRRKTSPNPIWTLTSLGDGRLSIKVGRTVAGAGIVLLLRSDSGERIIQPKQVNGNDYLFETGVGDGDRLDLYQLSTNTTDHRKLSETMPVDGQRVRIYP